ncbi:MAG: aminotransferase class III-fold pyridoxal phosphate-dependent enzyme [Candidatus Dormibacteraceae bacterium]
MQRLLETRFNAGGRAPVRIVGGEGVHFVLDNGRRVIDGSNTGGPLGHQHPDLVQAIHRAATNPVVNDGWLWAEREDAARELFDIAFAGEGSWIGAVRFFISGSEANDLALSLAQAITGRSALATRERAYHGMVGLARDVTVQPHWHGGLAIHGGGSRPVPRGAKVNILPGPVGARYGGVRALPLSERLRDAEKVLRDSAAVIIDYSQGGVYYDAEYQDRVADAARKAGALWIADEVVTGFARTGRWFGFQGADSRPDMVTLGKPLGGGAAAAGAVVLSQKLVDQLEDKTWQTFSTFRGHPTMITAMRTLLRVIERDGLVQRVAALDSFMERRLLDIAERHPAVARVDGRGLHWTLELNGPSWKTWYADTDQPPLASQVALRALEAGALIGTSGEQTSVFLAPALIVSEPELEQLLEALDHGLDAADSELERT